MIGDRWPNIYRALKSWRKGLPPSWQGELWSNYGFNGGLTRTTWYQGSLPWYKPGGYQCAIEPWRLSRMKPYWPILADLREAGQWGYGGQCISANHSASGYNVLTTQGAVRWSQIKSDQFLVNVVKDYTSWETTHSPMCNTWRSRALIGEFQ